MDHRVWSRRDFLSMGGACGLSALGWGLSFPPAPMDYRARVLADEPAGYWRLGERQGPVARDETCHRTDGAFHGRIRCGEPGALAHDPNSAAGLEGRDAFVEVPDRPHFSQPSSGRGLTVEVWMRPDLLVFDGETQDPYVHWLGKGETGAYEWGMRFYSRNSSRPSRISAYVWNPDGGLGAGAYFQDPLQAGEWIHVVACYDPGDASDPTAGVSIYRDGRLRGGPQTQKGARYSSYGIQPRHGSAPVRFGTRDRRSFFAGTLDEVAIYPRVLTAREIAGHYRAAAGL
jgi:Concanavalin A-like lectin/glucanases superfamily